MTPSITQSTSGKLSIFCATAGVATLAIGAIAFHHIGAFSSFDQMNAIIMMGCGGGGIVLAIALYKVAQSSNNSNTMGTGDKPKLASTTDATSIKQGDEKAKPQIMYAKFEIMVSGNPRKIFRLIGASTFEDYRKWGITHLETGMYILFRPKKMKDFLLVSKNSHGEVVAFKIDIAHLANPDYERVLGNYYELSS
jgi:hypothetical protein